MIREKITEFLRTGELTNFPFATYRQVITDQLGDNPDWTVAISRKDKRPAIIKYGFTEFYFNALRNQMLCGVQVIYSQPADEKEFDMDYSELRESLSYRQVMDFLKKHHIPFEEKYSEYDPDDRILKTGG